MLLEIEGLSVSYGAVEALKGVSLQVDERQLIGVLGANGAGKTTLLRAISGLVRAREGTIRFQERDLGKLPPHEIALMGVTHVPEGRGIFATLTVEENLNLGGYGRPKEEVARAKERVFSLFPILKERRRQLAGTLSGGEQQMLALGRGLIRSPKIMLLDEPSLGLAPILVEEVFKVIRGINQNQGVTILLVEQNARKALGLVEYGYVLELGRIALEGPAARLRADERVRAAYLGGRAITR
ncbi:ABC transporter ATP-binding protein [Candidatus Bipolaricaulota bacterium]|nr:ABC transporter ATP-binding protein [Candidatus Bipolaricaulota bacterium]